MQAIAQRRNDIYNFFHASVSCQSYFFAPDREDDYAAYYTAMFLLQDTSESLMHHRQKEFPTDSPLQAYLEFWGVLQAVFIQQDAIIELRQVVFEHHPSTAHLTAWTELREFRNVCAGHPVRKDRPKPNIVRSFMGRGFGGYQSVKYERWERDGTRSYPRVPFGQMIDDYSVEAAEELAKVLTEMKRRWP
ncbi:hypothetical protein [Paraburkholderia megapolitana]|uniref:hypothetical protein n=1 Tax=Paraburkholderia megapolitana TaxID=420953 RepID=UPI0038B741FE